MVRCSTCAGAGCKVHLTCMLSDQACCAVVLTRGGNAVGGCVPCMLRGVMASQLLHDVWKIQGAPPIGR